MKNDGSKPASADAARKAERDARLAEQLRANLKRRKAAARSDAARQRADADSGAENPAHTSERATKRDDGTVF